jgi:hypothetical protein
MISCNASSTCLDNREPEYGKAPGVGTRHLLQESGSEIRRLGRSASGALRGATGVSLVGQLWKDSRRRSAA